MHTSSCTPASPWTKQMGTPWRSTAMTLFNPPSLGLTTERVTAFVQSQGQRRAWGHWREGRGEVDDGGEQESLDHGDNSRGVERTQDRLPAGVNPTVAASFLKFIGFFDLTLSSL